MNSPYLSALTACRVALKSFANPGHPATEGDFVPLTLRVPEDSMFNVRRPTPTFMISNTRVILIDTMLRAMAEALGDRAMAGHYGNLFGFTIFGTDPGRERLYIHQEPQVGGWGATRERDGENALIFMTNAGCRILSAGKSQDQLRQDLVFVRIAGGQPHAVAGTRVLLGYEAGAANWYSAKTGVALPVDDCPARPFAVASR